MLIGILLMLNAFWIPPPKYHKQCGAHQGIFVKSSHIIGLVTPEPTEANVLERSQSTPISESKPDKQYDKASKSRKAPALTTSLSSRRLKVERKLGPRDIGWMKGWKPRDIGLAEERTRDSNTNTSHSAKSRYKKRRRARKRRSSMSKVEDQLSVLIDNAESKVNDENGNERNDHKVDGEGQSLQITTRNRARSTERVKSTITSKQRRIRRKNGKKKKFEERNRNKLRLNIHEDSEDPHSLNPNALSVKELKLNNTKSLGVVHSEPVRSRTPTPSMDGLLFSEISDTEKVEKLCKSKSKKKRKSLKLTKSRTENGGKSNDSNPSNSSPKSEKNGKVQKPDLSKMRAQTVPMSPELMTTTSGPVTLLSPKSTVILPTNDLNRSRSQSGSKSRSKKKKKSRSHKSVHKKSKRRPKSTRISTLRTPRSVPVDINDVESDKATAPDKDAQGTFPGILTFDGKKIKMKAFHQQSRSAQPMELEDVINGKETTNGTNEMNGNSQNEELPKSWNGPFGLDMSLTENSLLLEQDTLFAEVNVNAEIEQRKHSLDDLSRQLDALVASDFELEFETSLHRTRSEQREFTRTHKQSVRELESDIEETMTCSVASTLTLLQDYEVAHDEETFL